MLVGDVANRTAILIDDLADTSNTITRAAKLLKKEGASRVYALVTHGVLSGDAIDRINASALDKVVVTNSVSQVEHQRRCPKLEVLDVSNVFAEVSVSFTTSTTRRMTADTSLTRQFVECIMVKVSAHSSSTTELTRILHPGRGTRCFMYRRHGFLSGDYVFVERQKKRGRAFRSRL